MNTDAPPFGQIAIYTYLRGLIGSNNAWRTSEELCVAAGAKTDNERLRVQQALHKLAKDARIMRRQRPGTRSYECMALILDAKDELRAPRFKAKPSRVEIATPADGTVALRVEPAPIPHAATQADRLEKALTLADVLAKHTATRKDAEPEPEPMREEPDGDVDDMPDPVAEPDGEAPDDPLDIELANVMEALQAPRRVPVHIHDLDKKLNVLSSIAMFLPPITRRIVNGVVKDLERVHGS